MNLLQKVRLFSGLTLMAVAVIAIGTGGVFMVPPATLVAMIAGYLLSPWIAAPVVRIFEGFTYSGKAAEPPEQFTRVKALIVQQQYAEAECELRNLLRFRPGLLEGQWLLASLLYERLKQPEAALAVVVAALPPAWRPDCEKLYLLGTDILLELDRQEEAIALLRTGATRAAGTPAAAQLSERLHHLTVGAG